MSSDIRKFQVVYEGVDKGAVAEAGRYVSATKEAERTVASFNREMQKHVKQSQLGVTATREANAVYDVTVGKYRNLTQASKDLFVSKAKEIDAQALSAKAAKDAGVAQEVAARQAAAVKKATITEVQRWEAQAARESKAQAAAQYRAWDQAYKAVEVAAARTAREQTRLAQQVARAEELAATKAAAARSRAYTALKQGVSGAARTANTYGTLPALGVIGYAANSAMNLEQSVANISSIAKINPDKVYQQLNEMQKHVRFSATQLAGELYDIFSSIEIPADQGVQLLEKFSRGAVGSMTDIQTWGTSVMGVMNAYHKNLQDVNHIQDLFFNTIKAGVVTGPQLAQGLGLVTAYAKRAGSSMEEMFAAIAAGTKEGGPAEQNLNDIANMFQKIYGEKALEGWNAMGIKVTDARGHFLPLVETIGQLKERLEKLTPFQKSQFLAKMLPDRQAQAGLGKLISQYDFFTKQVHENEKATGSAEAAYKKMSETAQNKMVIALNSVNAKLNEMMVKYLPRLADSFEKFANWLDKLDPKTVEWGLKIGLLGGPILSATNGLMGLFGWMKKLDAFTFTGAAIKWLGRMLGGGLGAASDFAAGGFGGLGSAAAGMVPLGAGAAAGVVAPLALAFGSGYVAPNKIKGNVNPGGLNLNDLTATAKPGQMFGDPFTTRLKEIGVLPGLAATPAQVDAIVSKHTDRPRPAGGTIPVNPMAQGAPLTGALGEFINGKPKKGPRGRASWLDDGAEQRITTLGHGLDAVLDIIFKKYKELQQLADHVHAMNQSANELAKLQGKNWMTKGIDEYTQGKVHKDYKNILDPVTAKQLRDEYAAEYRNSQVPVGQERVKQMVQSFKDNFALLADVQNEIYDAAQDQAKANEAWHQATEAAFTKMTVDKVRNPVYSLSNLPKQRDVVDQAALDKAKEQIQSFTSDLSNIIAGSLDDGFRRGIGAGIGSFIKGVGQMILTIQESRLAEMIANKFGPGLAKGTGAVQTGGSGGGGGGLSGLLGSFFSNLAGSSIFKIRGHSNGGGSALAPGAYNEHGYNLSFATGGFPPIGVPSWIDEGGSEIRDYGNRKIITPSRDVKIIPHGESMKTIGGRTVHEEHTHLHFHEGAPVNAILKNQQPIIVRGKKSADIDTARNRG